MEPMERLWKKTAYGRPEGACELMLALLAWCLVPLYALASGLKRAVFESGLWPKTKVRVPVISIGNITAGGAGKTQVTRLVASILAEKYGHVVVLSRGYRSANRRWILEVSRRGRLLASSEEGGDEAWMLARMLPSASVVSGKRRALTARYAADELSADVVLLDDGMQYWRLERDLDIVTINAAMGFGNALPFPRGPMREPLRALGRAGLVIVAHTDGGFDRRRDSELRARIAQWSDAPLVSCVSRPACLRPLHVWEERLPLETLRNERIMAVAGIAFPELFFETLRRLLRSYGVAPDFPTASMSDHHKYTGEEIAGLEEIASAGGCTAVVTTAKDEANIPAHAGSSRRLAWYILDIVLEPRDEGEKELLREVLSAALATKGRE